MVLNMNEQEMVNYIKKHYLNYVIIDKSSKSVSGPSENCDIALIFNNETYYLEAKADNDNNNPNYAKQCLAECLYNRNKHGYNNNYGLLLGCSKIDKSEIARQIKSNITLEDWMKFGKTFNCKKIFIFEFLKSELYCICWDDLYKDNINSVMQKLNKSI
jgi:hypothetical protein